MHLGCPMDDFCFQVRTRLCVSRLVIVDELRPSRTAADLVEGSQEFPGAIGVRITALIFPVLAVFCDDVDDAFPLDGQARPCRTLVMTCSVCACVPSRGLNRNPVSSYPDWFLRVRPSRVKSLRSGSTAILSAPAGIPRLAEFGGAP